MLAVVSHFIHGVGKLLRWIDRNCKPEKLYFPCGSCEPNLRCCRPPDPQCVVWALQLARGESRVLPPHWTA